jgi:hypothetical protein
MGKKFYRVFAFDAIDCDTMGSKGKSLIAARSSFDVGSFTKAIEALHRQGRAMTKSSRPKYCDDRRRSCDAEPSRTMKSDP